MARTKQTARKSTGGKAPRRFLPAQPAQAAFGMGRNPGFGQTFAPAPIPAPQEQESQRYTLKSYKGGMISAGGCGRRGRRFRRFGAQPDQHTFDEVDAAVPEVHPVVGLPGPESAEERAQRLATHTSEYAASYSGLGADDHEGRRRLLSDAVQKENEYRKIFAQDRENQSLEDPYAMMLPVHQHQPIFTCTSEPQIPLVCGLGEEQKPAGTPAVVSREEFLNNFNVFTEGLLTHINWGNVFAAGGCVLAALMPVPEEYAESNQTRREYYHEVAYKNSDIDLFIYGLDEEAANEKLKEIYFHICERTMPLVNTICFRSKNSISIVSQFPYRHVQIILRLYKSPAEVLMGFDVDACSVGFDGRDVWMTPRCHHALVAQANTIDMSRRSPTYEVRLAKYASRGFAVEVPDLDRSKIDPQIFERKFDSVKGLAKLLLLERLSTPEARHKFKEQQRLRHLRPTYEKKGAYYNIIQHHFANDSYLTERIEETQASPSDYSCVFLPWGPAWNASKIRKLMYTKDVLLNSDMFAGKPKRHRHPCFFGTLEEVLGDCCGDCPEDEDAEDGDKDDEFVHGDLTWMTTNPGQQSIGSFHPITTGDWTEGAYVNEVTEDLVLAVARGKEGDVGACLAKPGANPNAKDVTGRTPLMIAAFTNNVAAAKALLAAGAFVSERLQDGRSALHIAAAYGHHEIVALLLEQGKIANKALEAQIEQDRVEEQQRRAEEGEEEEEEDDECHDSDWYRKQYFKRRAKEEREAKRRAEMEEKRTLDRLEIDKEDFDHRMSPLMYAVFFGWTECARLLIESGADVAKALTYQSEGRDTCTYPLLHLACINNQIEVAKLLLEKGASLDQTDNQGNTPIYKALHLQRVDILRLYATFNGRRQYTRIVTPFPGQSPAFQEAMLNEHFFNSGLSAEEFVAALKKMARAVAPPADLAADGTVPNKASLNWLNNNRQTPLLYLLNTHPKTETAPELATILIDAGAAVHFTEDHAREFKLRTGIHVEASSLPQPIHVAAEAGAAEILKKLLAAKADVNAIRGGNATYRRSSAKRSFFNSNQGGSYQTPLDIVAQRLRELQEGVEQKVHVTGQEFLEFLISKTEKNTFQYYTLSKMLNNIYTGRNSVTPGKDILNHESEEEKAEKAEQRRKDRELFSACRELLLAEKALPFVELKFPEDDPNNYRAAQRAAQKPNRVFQHFGGFGRQPAEQNSAYKLGVDSPPLGNLAFQENFVEIPDEGNFANTPVDSALQHRYLELFDAIIRGDVATIRALTIEAPNEEERLIVCVASTLVGMSTLQVAMDANQPDVVSTLLDIAVKQYTPKPTKEEEDSDSVSSGTPFAINNIDLASAAGSADANVRQLLSLMSQAKVAKMPKGGLATKRRGINPLQPATAAAEPVKLICTVAPTDFVLWFSAAQNNSGNALQAAIQAGNTDAIRSLFDSIEKHSLKLVNPQTKTETPLVTALLRSESPRVRQNLQVVVNLNFWTGMTPFELAVWCDHVDVAKLLLARGATDCLAFEEEWLLKGDGYEGLTVAGQKVQDSLAQHVRLARSFRSQHRLRGLHVAATNNSLKAIEFLLGGDTNGFIMVDFDEAWDTASTTSSGAPPLFSLEQRDDNGLTALHVAIQNNHPEALKRLLELGQQQLGAENLKRVIDLTSALRPTDKDPTFEIQVPAALALAVQHDSAECTETLLAFGADPMVAYRAKDEPNKAPGESPLHIAVTLCNPVQIDALLKANADVARPGPHLWNSLHYVVKAKKHRTKSGVVTKPQQITERLLAAESSKPALNARSDLGETPLMVAAQHGNTDFLEALLKAGADATLRDNNGKTALHHASKANSRQCVEALLRTETPYLNSEDHFGHTPLDWLMRNMSRQLATTSEAAANDALSKLKEVHTTVKRQIASPDDVRSVTISAVQVVTEKEKEKKTARPFMVCTPGSDEEDEDDCFQKKSATT